MRFVSYIQKHVKCQIDLPLSKSILNRLLIINYLSGNAPVNGIEKEAADVVSMHRLLHEISLESGTTDAVTELNAGNAGTVMRFLTALLAITPGKWKLTGSERMLQRPIQSLTDALQQLGADIQFENIAGCPPFIINGNAGLTGGKLEINAGISSQFVSALMMIAPLLKTGLTIYMKGEVISSSYIRMTQALMQKCGAKVRFDGNEIAVEPGSYSKVDFSAMAEPDWSAAAFWYQVAAFAPNADILLLGVKEKSVQGDSVLPEIFGKFGVSSEFTDEGLHITKSSVAFSKEFDYDFTDCPDLAQAVIVTCAALGIKGRYSGLKTLRVKETDRIAALKNELSKLGYGVEIDGDEIILNGKIHLSSKTESPVVIRCYDDHRMAMSFATLALLRSDICLDEPEVVKKSYPGFWRDMEEIGIVIMS
jgi:3-phosphoshikimate 1-carboxyvinyltransferase